MPNMNVWTTEHKKRLARILAARAGHENVSGYINTFRDKEIGELRPDEQA